MNKNSKVLALKYRPQNFFELIGQEVIAETIINSIKANKVPNAYLFTGIRGVGLHCQDFHVLGVFEADKIRGK